MRQTITAPSLVCLALALISLGLGGTTAWREIHVHHDFRTVKQQRGDAASYEKQYAGTTSWPHPQIESVQLGVTIDPSQKQLRYEGVWMLRNTDRRIMDHLYIEMPEDAEPAQLSAANRFVKLQSWDEVHRVGIWQLSPALQTGERLALQVKSGVRFYGFEEKPFEGTVGDDTAWFRNSYLPRFGYDPTREIDSPTQRKEYGLGSRRARQVIPDRLAVNDDAGWADIDLSVSLPATWSAVASGIKTGETQNGPAKTLHFEAKHVPLAIQIVAGKLETHQVLLTSVNGRRIPLTLAFHPRHHENVDRMTTILQDAFTEFEQRFGPCPADAISLGEIPQYQEDIEPASLTPVQSSNGMITMPERLGWLHNYRTQPARDWLTFVLAQELARAWWGDGVGAQEGPGSALIDEGMSTLLGLVMIEKSHGAKAADDYASILQDRLRRRMAREVSENPTILTTNFEDYAGMQAALVLFEERKKAGESTFDRLIGQAWRDNLGKGPVSPSSFASEIQLSSNLGTVSAR